jgi:hypothetical protein
LFEVVGDEVGDVAGAFAAAADDEGAGVAGGAARQAVRATRNVRLLQLLRITRSIRLRAPDERWPWDQSWRERCWSVGETVVGEAGREAPVLPLLGDADSGREPCGVPWFMP